MYYYKHIALLFAITTLTITLLSTSQVNASSVPLVAFRMDDIQDWWLEDAQQTVINVFKSRKLPLTIGIIANYFYTDGHTTMRDFVKKCLKTSGFPIEIANHGWKHEDFTTFSASKQDKLIKQAKAKTISDLSLSDLTTFIPPFNKFDDNTIAALKNNGFKTMSAGISEYTSRNYPGTKSSFREYPVGSSTTDLSDSYKISAEESFEMIQDQIRDHGFSAVMMHFVEFTDDDGDIDYDALDDLVRLIDMVKDAGYKMTTIGGLTKELFGSKRSMMNSTEALEDENETKEKY